MARKKSEPKAPAREPEDAPPQEETEQERAAWLVSTADDLPTGARSHPPE